MNLLNANTKQRAAHLVQAHEVYPSSDLRPAMINSTYLLLDYTLSMCPYDNKMRFALLSTRRPFVSTIDPLYQQSSF